MGAMLAVVALMAGVEVVGSAVQEVISYFNRPPAVPTLMPTHPQKSEKVLREEAKTKLGINFNHFNFGIAGNSGTGKSSLINAVRGVSDASPEAAKVSNVECTSDITKYPFPSIPHVVLWDLPGGGTERNKRDTYFMDKKLYAFDMIIVLVGERFTELDLAITKDAQRFNVPIVFVRSKSDDTIRNTSRRLGRTKKDVKFEVRDEIVEDMKLQLAEVLGNSKVFVINCRMFGPDAQRDQAKYGLDEVGLLEYIHKVVQARRSNGRALTC